MLEKYLKERGNKMTREHQLEDIIYEAIALVEK